MSAVTNDRELLELAAKAAGVEIDKSEFNGGGRGNGGFDVLGNAVLDWYDGVTWNPLTDDGDALRLAVKLGLIVEVMAPKESLRACCAAYKHFKEQGKIMEFAGDATSIESATRRAIVRAAAEIGKQMP